MILILGGPGDEDAAAVYRELERKGAQVARFDSDRYSGIGAVSVALASASRLDGVTSASGREVHVEDIRAVWLGSRDSAEDEVLYDLWGMLSAPTIPASPSTTQYADDTRRQLKYANQLGFAVSSAIRPNINAVRNRAEQAALTYKSEVAVVCVGGKVFAADMEPTVHGSHVVMQAQAPYILPLVDAERCTELVDMFDLEYAILHFGVTYDNTLIFLGLDPRGTYRHIEKATDLRITRAIADLLMVRAGRHANFLNAESHLESGPWSLSASLKAHPSFHALHTVKT